MAGRPKRPKALRKEENINIRVTAEQKAELTAAATRAGVGVSPWMLLVALEKARKTDGDG